MRTTFEHAFFLATGEELPSALQRLKLVTDSIDHTSRRVVRGENGCMPGRNGKCVICGTGDCLRRAD